jgi:hypothetical protein
MLVYFMAIWSILLPFGIFYGYLLCLVRCTKKNLATLEEMNCFCCFSAASAFSRNPGKRFFSVVTGRRKKVGWTEKRKTETFKRGRVQIQTMKEKRVLKTVRKEMERQLEKRDRKTVKNLTEREYKQRLKYSKGKESKDK